MHDRVVGVGRCRPKVSASRSGRETRAVSHSRDSLHKEGKNSLVVPHLTGP